MTILRLCVALGFAVGGASWLAAVDLAGTPLGWPSHVLASAAPQLGMVFALVGLWWVIRARWLAGLVSIGAAALAVGSLGPTLLGERPGPIADTGSVTVRLAVANCLASNEDRRGLVDALLGTDADALAVLEAPGWLIDELRNQQAAGSGPFRERYPHYFVPDRAGAGFMVLLTKEPMGSFGSGSTNPNAVRGPGWRGGVTAKDGSAYGVGLVHPASPRSPARHRRAEEGVLNALKGLSGADRDEPLFVLGDLNSTPTGAHSVRLGDGLGLVRAKPVDALTGTYPAWAPWPLQVAIDGVLVRPDADVTLWQTFNIPGSDHLGVVVTARLRD